MSTTPEAQAAAEAPNMEGPGLPLVASYYVQGRYRRASVTENRGQPLTFLHAAAEWRQKAMLRQQTIIDLVRERDSLRATIAAHPAPAAHPPAVVEALIRRMDEAALCLPCDCGELRREREDHLTWCPLFDFLVEWNEVRAALQQFGGE